MSLPVRPAAPGAALLGVALAAGAAGALRQELGALLWGAVFLGLGLYAFLTVLAVYFRIRSFQSSLSSDPRPFDGETGFPGTPLTASWQFSFPLRLFPGVFIQGEVCAIRPGREMRAFSILTPGKTAEVTFPEPLRGTYRILLILHCRDALGLFHASLPLPGEGRLTVYPPSVLPREGRELPSLGGTGPAEQRSLRRNEELFDLRKYQPGDDPRRVHWKLFAHMEELFIRQGEEEPPPSGEYPVFLDLTRPGLPADRRTGASKSRRHVPSLRNLFSRFPLVYDLSEAYLDGLLGRFSLWGQEILRRGGVLTLYGAGEPERFRAGQEEALLSFLAGLCFHPAGKETLPEETLRFYYLVTPYAEGWPSRFHHLQEKGTGRTGYLVVPPPPSLGELPGPAGLLKRLLFCREASEVSLGQERDLLRRSDQLQREAPKASPRGGVHVL